jgi:hypothetical protein
MLFAGRPDNFELLPMCGCQTRLDSLIDFGCYLYVGLFFNINLENPRYMHIVLVSGNLVTNEGKQCDNAWYGTEQRMMMIRLGSSMAEHPCDQIGASSA